MFGIGGGGGFNPVSLVSQAALAAATGGSSLLVQAAFKSVMTAVGDHILQQVGQRLGLPQSVIDIAQAAFHSAAGNPSGAAQNLQEAGGGLANALGGNSFDAGNITREATSAGDDAVDQILENIRGNSSLSNDIKAATKGKSLLVAMAIAMGMVADEKMNRMHQITQELGDLKSGDKGYASKTGELQGLGQEMNMISQALSNSIKSIGEAASTLARKN